MIVALWIALVIVGLVFIALSLNTEAPGGVGTGGLAALFIGVPLAIVGIIGLAVHYLF